MPQNSSESSTLFARRDVLRVGSLSVGASVIPGLDLAAAPFEPSGSAETLRSNPIAERELRLFGKYPVLFNVDEENEEVTIILVDDKRGNSLFAQGEEFTGHESDTAE